MLKRIGRWVKGLFRREVIEPEVEEEETETGLMLNERISVLRQNEVMIEFLPMLVELVLDVRLMLEWGVGTVGDGYQVSWAHDFISPSRLCLMHEDEVILGNIGRTDTRYPKEVHERFQFNPEILFSLKTDDLLRLKEAWVTLKAFQEKRQAEEDAEEKEKAQLKAEYSANVEKQIKDLGIDKIAEEERERHGKR